MSVILPNFLFTAGSDNTVSTILGFFLAVLSNPEAQAKAQKEIDSVIANGELPTFEDRDSLPYVTALVTEVLRWCLSSPLGIYCATLVPRISCSKMVIQADPMFSRKMMCTMDAG